MAWTVNVAKPAQKQAARVPAKDQAKIGAAVSAMADDPFAGDVSSSWKAEAAAGDAG
jgi:hypothetical protein